MKEGPGSSKQVWGSARAVGGNLFFALWEANPFWLRAITFTRTLTHGVGEEKGAETRSWEGVFPPEAGCGLGL